MLRNMMQSKSSELMRGAIQSVTEVTIGTVATAAVTPAEGKEVVIFGTARCGYCIRARRYMDQHGIPYDDRDVDTNALYQQQMRALGARGVPMIVMGSSKMNGFSEPAFQKMYDDYKRSHGATASHPVASGANDSPAGDQPALRAGETLRSKITGIKVYRQPNKSGEALATLVKNDDVVYLGDEQNGLYRVASPHGEGWVDKLLLIRP